MFSALGVSALHVLWKNCLRLLSNPVTMVRKVSFYFIILVYFRRILFVFKLSLQLGNESGFV